MSCIPGAHGLMSCIVILAYSIGYSFTHKFTCYITALSWDPRIGGGARVATVYSSRHSPPSEGQTRIFISGPHIHWSPRDRLKRLHRLPKETIIITYLQMIVF